MPKRIYIRLAELMARQRPPLTQRGLAEATGIAQSTLSRIYRNKSSQIDFDTVATLCEFFECEIEDLLVCEESEEHAIA